MLEPFLHLRHLRPVHSVHLPGSVPLDMRRTDDAGIVL